MDDYIILNKINVPSDVKNLSEKDTDLLCSEIRDFLVDNVSKTGGHLSSNLGVVELTVAFHKVFDSPKDRFIFDVGHQSYVHKLLTGRRDDFSQLRTFNGISGFPNPSESEYDAFISGHASTSVSVGLGMARARALNGGDFNVVCLIGDGALTGGMAYEALNDAGQSKEPLIVMLNDNNMSIAKNVGAISKHLSRLRIKPSYVKAKDFTKCFLNYMPGGKTVTSFISRVKSSFRWLFLPGSFFEHMGFVYLGPANGHDIKTICYLLNYAKSLKKPVIIHFLTKKGKGYKYSEISPDQFHGVSKFDVNSGEPLSSGGGSFSKTFGETLCELAENDSRISAVTAAMQSGTGLTEFAKRFRERFFDVGIAEGHAVTMAAGMASLGIIPVCAIYSTFLQRAYDQIIHDVAIQNLHVVFAVDRSGIVGEDGPTHNGVFDNAYLFSVPGMTVLCPSNYEELRSMLKSALYDINGPVAIKYPRGPEGDFSVDTSASPVNIVMCGNDITILTYGILINEAIKAASMLKAKGYSADIIKVNRLNPIETDEIKKSINKTGNLIIVEESVESGSFAEKLLTLLMNEDEKPCKVKLLNTQNRFLPQGDRESIFSMCGINAEGIYNASLEAIGVE